MPDKDYALSSLLSVGVYSVPEAGRILHVKPRIIRRWLEGYEFKHEDRSLKSGPVVQRDGDRIEGLLTFRDLIELLFISLFRQKGLSLQSIRKAAQVAASDFGVDYPFTVKRFDTDGKRVFATLAERDHVVQVELLKRQFMFKEFTSGLFKKLEYGEDLTAHRYWPWGKQGGIVLDPTIQFGAPLASNSGIPTSALYEAWRGNKGDISLVAKWYCVDREEIENAIKFEQELLRAA